VSQADHEPIARNDDATHPWIGVGMSERHDRLSSGYRERIRIELIAIWIQGCGVSDVSHQALPKKYLAPRW